MTDGNFPARFVIDEHFVSHLLKDKTLAVTTFSKLTQIHTKSSQHPFCHNIIFDESFKACIKGKEIRGQAILGAAHPIPIPDFLREEKDPYAKLIRYSISIVDKIPRRIIILTSPEKQKDYENNQHYKDDTVKEAIKIMSGSWAIQLIDIISNF